MNELLVLYDHVAFDDEYSASFYTYTGDYDEIKAAGSVILWQWPGSGIALWTTDYLDTVNFSVSYAYMDEQGREWGFIGYLYGHRNIWVCLSDPLNSNIPIFNPTPEPAEWVPDTLHTDILQHGGEQGSEIPTLAVIVVLVTALVAGTAMLIKVLYAHKG
jgi:hypothetical protein